jgi:hypothetical protein
VRCSFCPAATLHKAEGSNPSALIAVATAVRFRQPRGFFNTIDVDRTFIRDPPTGSIRPIAGRRMPRGYPHRKITLKQMLDDALD